MTSGRTDGRRLQAEHALELLELEGEHGGPWTETGADVMESKNTALKKKKKKKHSSNA